MVWHTHINHSLHDAEAVLLEISLKQNNEVRPALKVGKKSNPMPHVFSTTAFISTPSPPKQIKAGYHRRQN
jgi:hypothetical protein